MAILQMESDNFLAQISQVSKGLTAPVKECVKFPNSC